MMPDKKIERLERSVAQALDIVCVIRAFAQLALPLAASA